MMLDRLGYALRSLIIFLGLTLATGLISIVLIPPLEEYSWAVYLFLWSGTSATLVFFFLRQRIDSQLMVSRMRAWRIRIRSQVRVETPDDGPRSAEGPSDGYMGDATEGAPMNIRTRTSTHPWTAAQEEELRRLARANIPPREIAQRLSRTPEAVFERAYELGLNLAKESRPH